MMRVVHLIPNLSAGGAERFVVDLLNSLSKSGYSCHLILFNPEGNFFISELEPSVTVYYIHKRSGYDFTVPFRLRYIINQIKPDVVHSHLSAFNYLGLSFLLNRSVKYFHTIHSLPKKEYKSKLGRLLRILFFKVFQRSTPISISQSVHDEARLIYGKNVQLIFNGREAPVLSKENIKILERFSNYRYEGYKIITNIGSFKRAKNQSQLIRAVTKLNRDGYKVKLIIVGGDLNSNEFLNLKELSDNNVVFVGPVTNPQDYIYHSDFFILPSLWEGMPISLIEAFALGKVSICNNVGGMANMIKDGFNGFLIRGDGETKIREALLKVFSIPYSKLSQVSKIAESEYHDKYSMEICLNNHLKSYGK